MLYVRLWIDNLTSGCGLIHYCRAVDWYFNVKLWINALVLGRLWINTLMSGSELIL